MPGSTLLPAHPAGARGRFPHDGTSNRRRTDRRRWSRKHRLSLDPGLHRLLGKLDRRLSRLQRRLRLRRAAAWADSVTGGSTRQLRHVRLCLRRDGAAPTTKPGRSVFGVEADGDWADASGSGTVTTSTTPLDGRLPQHRTLGSAPCAAAPAMRSIASLSTARAARRCRQRLRASFSDEPNSEQRDQDRLDGRRGRRRLASARNWFGERLEYLFFVEPRRRVMHDRFARSADVSGNAEIIPERRR